MPRDRRFVAAHRGGPLDAATHRVLAVWAADCAERLVDRHWNRSRDGRPRRAIDTVRAWIRGHASVGDCMRAAVTAHAAARAAARPAAVAAARAAGHAAATAHAADHSLGVVIYGAKAVTAAGGSATAARVRQLARLPPPVRTLVVSALARRAMATSRQRDPHSRRSTSTR